MDVFDEYFETISALISLLLRRLVENTLEDLEKFFLNYKQGNTYEEGNDYMHTNLNMTVPFVSYLSSDALTSHIVLVPDIEMTHIEVNDTIDEIIQSVNNFPRLEKFLFENVDLLELKYPNRIHLDEDAVVNFKEIFKEILFVNLKGPKM